MRSGTLSVAVWVLLVLCVAGCRRGTGLEVAAVGTGAGKDREAAAGSLAERVVSGELRPDQKKQLAERLTSALREWREGRGTIYPPEADLAWKLALSRDVTSEARLALMHVLDPVSSRFTCSGTPSLGLDGDRAPEAPAGLIALHGSRVVAVDGEAVNVPGFDVVIGSRHRGSITSRYKVPVPLPKLPSRSLAVEVRTGWYQLPADSLAGRTPCAADPDLVREFRILLAAQGAQELLAETRTLTLVNESEGDRHFQPATATSPGGQAVWEVSDARGPIP